MRTLFIFFLTCIVELSQLALWVALFFHAATWPHAWKAIVTGGPTAGFAVLFACVASLVVPLVMGAVFGIVLLTLKRPK